MKYFAEVNEFGYLQVRHEPDDSMELGRGQVEVGSDVVKELAFYELKGGKAVKKPPAAVDAILAARAEQERRKKKLDELLSR